MAQQLAGRSASLALAAWNAADVLEETRRQCGQIGAQAISLAASVSREEDCRRFVDAAVQWLAVSRIRQNWLARTANPPPKSYKDRLEPRVFVKGPSWRPKTCD